VLLETVISSVTEQFLITYWSSHDCFVCMHTKNKMAFQRMPYFRAFLELFVGLLESCKRAIGWALLGIKCCWVV